MLKGKVVGKFKFIQKRHRLKIEYRLDYFEIYQERQLFDFLYLEYEKKNKYSVLLNNVITITDYLNRGVTTVQFMNIINQLIVIIKQLESVYIKQDCFLLHYNQFLFDENRQKLLFLYVPSSGENRYISFHTLIQKLITHAIFQSYEDAQYALLLQNSKTLKEVEKIVSVCDEKTEILSSSNLEVTLNINSTIKHFNLNDGEYILDVDIDEDGLQQSHVKMINHHSQLCFKYDSDHANVLLNGYEIEKNVYYILERDDKIVINNIVVICEGIR